MSAAVLTVLVDRHDDGVNLLAPAVGRWLVGVGDGALVAGGTELGRLRVLNRCHRLVVPPGIRGRVRLEEATGLEVAAGYRQVLCRLEPDGGTEAVIPAGEEAPAAALELSDGQVVTAFTTGILYRRPSPDAPPYVEEGAVVEPGKVLGLIEVMKSFNQIVFDGGEHNRSGRVVRVLADDAVEVRSGQPLFVIQPLDPDSGGPADGNGAADEDVPDPTTR